MCTPRAREERSDGRRRVLCGRQQWASSSGEPQQAAEQPEYLIPPWLRPRPISCHRRPPQLCRAMSNKSGAPMVQEGRSFSVRGKNERRRQRTNSGSTGAKTELVNCQLPSIPPSIQRRSPHLLSVNHKLPYASRVPPRGTRHLVSFRRCLPAPDWPQRLSNQ